MPKWPEGTKKFVMKVVPDRYTRTEYVNIPKPVRDVLGNPSRVEFTIRGNKAIIENAD